MRIPRYRTACITLCALTLATGALTAEAGFYYESVTQTKGAGPNSEQAVKGWVDGDRARIEFTKGDRDGFFAKGNYLVTTDGGDNVYLIDPGEETYAPFNMDEIMAQMGKAMEMMEQMGEMMSMEISDATSEKVLEEPGEKLLGYDTTHYRLESGYTLTMSVMGMKRENRSDSTVDIWSTDALDASGFGVWLKPSRQMKSGIEELDKVMGQSFDIIEGYPLKMVMHTSGSGGVGGSRGTTTTMEVTTLREESPDDSLFTWPDTYTETEVVPDIEKSMSESRKK